MPITNLLLFVCAPLGALPAEPLARPAAIAIPDVIPNGWHGVRIDRRAELDALRDHCCVQHVVQKGETMEKIAADALGDRKRVTEIVELNADVDPRRMKIGQRIWLPPRLASAPRQFVFRTTWPGSYAGRPFAATDRVTESRYGSGALMIVPAAALDEFHAAQKREDGYGAVKALAAEEKLQLVPVSGVGRYVKDGSPVVRRLETARVLRDAKGRFSVEVDCVDYDEDGDVVEAGDAGGEQSAWLLLLALGGAGLVWLRLRARNPAPAPALARA